MLSRVQLMIFFETVPIEHLSGRHATCLLTLSSKLPLPFPEQLLRNQNADPSALIQAREQKKVTQS